MSTAQYHSPVDPNSYPTLAVVLTSIGLMFMALFLVYEATTTKQHRNLFKELTLASLSSVILGLGLFFTLLWTGVYV
ncbi:hypothetical protein C9374_000290 [Naegleria lovaniensis]|uniref:Dolichyl-diphosphooligosaccharide-protein glycosyltransferase subunit OST5 n=1 Tax=Naegleria lovaniensis TaxID=51637 RepID=A0AA88GZG6_NAELO|nr:uncharacterized protein C9374_000290 [Naegleria lovaniensis]KAG2388851.1 hypothetical protein C9374_000290 [Naegleria lovaniensis]